MFVLWSLAQPHEMVSMRTIAAVAKVVGLKPDTLRAWEKRYGAIEPVRDRHGYRRYSDDEIARLKRLALLVGRGHPIRTLAGCTDNDLEILIKQSVPTGPPEYAVDLAHRLSSAALDPNGVIKEETLYRAALCLAPRVFLTEIVKNILTDVGDAWQQGKLRIAREHQVSEAFLNVLRGLNERIRRPYTQDTILSTMLAGERHAISALAFTYYALTRGVSTRFIGCDLGIEEIADTAKRSNVAVVSVSAVSIDLYNFYSQIRSLRSLLPDHVELWVGGRAVTHTRSQPIQGIHFLRSLKALDERLAIVYATHVSLLQ
jgi:methanogenic corrinoid protein MtbC1